MGEWGGVVGLVVILAHLHHVTITDPQTWELPKQDPRIPAGGNINIYVNIGTFHNCVIFYIELQYKV